MIFFDDMGDHEDHDPDADQVIANLPVIKFKREAGQQNDKLSCTVCMSDYEEGEDLKLLPCFHRFHDKCISQWLKTQLKCPICKTSVRMEEGEDGQ